jgi:hypothetical protein
MKGKNPKPRRGDRVERVDFSKMFGRVVGFQNSRNVRVKWADEKGVAIEKINNLALVERHPSSFDRILNPKPKKKLRKVI